MVVRTVFCTWYHLIFTFCTRIEGNCQFSCGFTFINPLGANFTKWSKTLKQFVGNLRTNCLNVFDHFVGLALKRLINTLFGRYLTLLIASGVIASSTIPNLTYSWIKSPYCFSKSFVLSKFPLNFTKRCKLVV